MHTLAWVVWSSAEWMGVFTHDRFRLFAVRLNDTHGGWERMTGNVSSSLEPDGSFRLFHCRACKTATCQRGNKACINGGCVVGRCRGALDKLF